MTLPRRCLHGVHRQDAACARVGFNFASALPARGASAAGTSGTEQPVLCLGAACTGCIPFIFIRPRRLITLPRRCLHGVHRVTLSVPVLLASLPRRCLHGVHPSRSRSRTYPWSFASALPARGASAKADKLRHTIL